MEGRIDLHTHTLLSDGELLPSELLRRAAHLNHIGLALTDHADATNLEQVISAVLRLVEQEGDDYPLSFLVGVELTHVAPRSIARLARQARSAGAELVIVHGETLSEPVAPGTNRAAVECPEVDLLAHPGLLTEGEARLAAERGMYLEISARKGNSLTNGHVAALARAAGAPLVVNSDAHQPTDLITLDMARRVARGAGMNDTEVEAAVLHNPARLIAHALERRKP
jgi:putative hydrolase